MKAISKKLLSLLVVITMVVSMVPGGLGIFAVETKAVTVENDYTKALEFEEGTTEAYCPACKEPVTWTAVTKNDSLGNKTSGHVHLYLTKSVTNTGAGTYLTVNGAAVCLHLNGFNITHAGRIQVTNGSGKISTLNIMGSGTVKSTATANTDGTINVAGGASTVNLYSGTYHHEGTASAPVRLYAKNATVNVYEAASVEGTTTPGVLIYTGKAGICNMEGGTVTGGIKADAGTVNLDGASTVDSITVAAAAKLVVKTGFTGTAHATFAAGLTEGAVPAANGASEGAYTGNLYLGSDNTQKLVSDGNGGLVLAQSGGDEDDDDVSMPETCPACGEENVTWTAISNTDNLGSKTSGQHHYYLTKDINKTNTSETYLTVNGASVCLHLNGFDLTYPGRIFVTNGPTTASTLNIMGSGTVKSTAVDSTAGTIVVAGGASTVNLYGGTYQYGGTEYAPIRLNAKGTVNMYEGATVEATETPAVLFSKAGYLNMEGGTVNGEIESAESIVGNVKMSSEGTVTIAGDVCIDSCGNNMTVNGSGKLYAMDSANDDYVGCGNWTVADGIEVADDATNPVNGNRYIVINDGATYSAHRFEMYLTAVTLRTTACGLYYKAAYKCDEALAAKVDSYGVVLSLEDMPGADFADDASNGFSCLTEGFEPNAGNNYTVNATSGALFNIMKTDNAETGDKSNASRGKMMVYANTYFEVDGKVYVGDEVNDGMTTDDEGFTGVAYSLFTVLKAIDDNWTTYASAQSKVTEFYNNWAGYGMSEWADEFTNIA